MRTAVLLAMAMFVSVSAALSGKGSATQAQTPPAESTASMSVTARVPVQAGASITIEALDPITLKPVACTTDRSAPISGADAGATSSRIFVTIAKASCVDGHSGNLRVCWGAEECAFFNYEDGKAVDLGLLSSKVVQHAPDTGGDADAGHQTSNRFQQLSVGLIGLGGLGLLACGLALTKRRRQARVP